MTRPYALPGGTLRRSFTLLGRGIAAHPRTFAIAIAASAVYGVATVASGWLLGRVTDELVVPLLQGGSELGAREIWLAGLALAGVALVLAVAVALRRTYAGAAAIDVQADHRRAVSKRYLELPMSWHRGRPTGELLSHASADAEAAGGVFVPLPFALGVVVMLVLAGGAMLAANVYLGIIGLAILPVVLAVNSVYRRLMSPAISHAQAERARVADAAHASFEAAAVVKTLGTADREVTGFAAATDDLRAANTAVGKIRAVFDAIIDLVPALATLAVLVVGADQIAAGQARPGDVVTASFLLTVMTFPVRAIGFVLGDIPRSLVGHERISGVVDAPDAVRGGSGTALPLGPDGVAPALALRAVGLDVPTAYGPVTLLDGVTFAVPRGERTAVVGSTGAGKSTLLDVMAGLTPHTSGRVELGGRDVAAMEHEEVAAGLAYVAQEAFVFDDSVRANVTLHEPGTPEPTDEEVWRALELARVADVVCALPDGLDTQLGERGTSLSGGQRQRLAIARALVRRPRVLLLDDATSALDPAVEQEILAGLAELADGGPTVVMVAYRPATILGADRVVHVEHGEVVAIGDVETLLRTDPGFSDLLTAYEKDRS